MRYDLIKTNLLVVLILSSRIFFILIYQPAKHTLLIFEVCHSSLWLINAYLWIFYANLPALWAFHYIWLRLSLRIISLFMCLPFIVKEEIELLYPFHLFWLLSYHLSKYSNLYTFLSGLAASSYFNFSFSCYNFFSSVSIFFWWLTIYLLNSCSFAS